MDVTGLISTLFWIILLGSTLLGPFFTQRRLEAMRLTLMGRMQKNRGSRVITLIHRQEALSLLGIPLSKYINIEDSEQVLRAIRMTPDDVPIDLIVHTPGGLVLAAEQIALALVRHKAKVTVFVPHYAMSGGTLLALAADEIVMDENAVLGPVDPQIGSYPAASILSVVERKPIENVDDNTLILADIAEKAISQVRETVLGILKENLADEQAEEVADLFTRGYFTHDYPLGAVKLQAMGLSVSFDMPTEVYKLMELYPQAAANRPSVGYVPMPYKAEPTREKPGRKSVQT
jgi:ClpP class serine protease